MINVMSALSHTFNHMFNQMVGLIPTKVESEDLSLEEMGLILKSPDYLSWGPMKEFQECITQFRPIVVIEDPDSRILGIVNYLPKLLLLHNHMTKLYRSPKCLLSSKKMELSI